MLWEQAEQKLKQSVEDEVKAKNTQAIAQSRVACKWNSSATQCSYDRRCGHQCQKVMEIVPDDAMEVEVNIANKDIGFIKEGQNATVKN